MWFRGENLAEMTEMKNYCLDILNKFCLRFGEFKNLSNSNKYSKLN